MSCENCELMKKKVGKEYLCQVLDGSFKGRHVCPPSVIQLLKEV